jgi:hypothetical protein
MRRYRLVLSGVNADEERPWEQVTLQPAIGIYILGDERNSPVSRPPLLEAFWTDKSITSAQPPANTDRGKRHIAAIFRSAGRLSKKVSCLPQPAMKLGQITMLYRVKIEEAPP